MSATTKNQQKGRELIQAFLNKYLMDTDLDWSGAEPDDENLDVHIFPSHGEGSIRVRCLLLDNKEGTYASPRYNLPAKVSPEGDSDFMVKQRAFLYLKGVYFLVVRQKGLSITFWLDKFTNYPLEAYTLQARFKGNRKDRIVLNYTHLNLKKFHYIEELTQRLKTAIHENSN